MNLSESYKKRLVELAGIVDGVVLKLPYGDKNISIQIHTNNQDVYKKALASFYELNKMFPELRLFLQANTGKFLMFESWAKEDELMYKAAEWVSKDLGLPLEID